MQELKLAISVNDTEKRMLKNRLSAIPDKFTSLRNIIKSVLKKDNVSKDYKEAFKELSEFIMLGFPKDCKISFASSSKGLTEPFSKAMTLYNECKEFDLKTPYFTEHLSIDKKTDSYKWKRSLDSLLDKLCTNYIKGVTAIALFKKVDRLLNDFVEIDTLSHRRIISSNRAILQATPLIKLNDNLTFGINHIAIQTLADSLDDAKLDDKQKGILDKILKDEN